MEAGEPFTTEGLEGMGLGRSMLGQQKWLDLVWHLDVTLGTVRNPDEGRQENCMVRYGF